MKHNRNNTIASEHKSEKSSLKNEVIISNKPSLNKKEVSLFFTKDPILLSQYYALREDSYRNELGFKEYVGSENEHDRNGHIVVAVCNNEVVAGARVSFADEVKNLPREEPEKGFTYKKVAEIYGIELPEKNYSEISALVIKKSFRNNLLAKIFAYIVDFCRKRQNKYIFGVSDAAYDRNYRINFKRIGVVSEIVKGVTAPLSPVYHNMKMFPLVIKI